MKKKKEPKY